MTGARRITVAHAAAVIAIAIASLGAVAGCADFEAPDAPRLSDAAVAVPSFSRDVQPIFTARCATQSCHNFATHQSRLVLEPDSAYSAIVNQPSTVPGVLLVEPGNPDRSLILLVLSPDSARRFGIQRMPLGRAPLTANQEATIRAWIAQGARQSR